MWLWTIIFIWLNPGDREGCSQPLYIYHKLLYRSRKPSTEAFMLHGQCHFDLLLTQTVLSVLSFSGTPKESACTQWQKNVEQSMPHRKSSPVHILCAISSRQVWPMLNLHSSSRPSLHGSTTQKYFWNFQQSTFLTKWKYVTCSPPRLLRAYW